VDRIAATNPIGRARESERGHRRARPFPARQAPKGNPMQTIDLFWLVATFATVYIPYLRDPRIHEIASAHTAPAECISDDWS
jgi:hypothetical protein